MDQKNEALLCAVRTGSVDGVKAAIAEGASANARYANGDRALHRAVANGHVEVVSLLLAAGANVHADHDAALRQAAASGHTEIVRLLLSAGADPLAAWASANRDERQSMVATLEACADAMTANQRTELAATSKQFVGLRSGTQTHCVHQSPQR